ncbi:Uncharacterised protein [Mycoplasmopsis bovigenitalium]|uniref:Lipoprotein n=1 Tax=Mycoplasmopsis bovigenitalium TaxID=2112 RepID=A0A449A8Y5_9BACT|nr:hypothetical protein [Mycoplasmopsis bovigenitalium]VEU60636.1 Uncharacterised protein [Mycoplasmopsis bovigenitalium]
MKHKFLFSSILPLSVFPVALTACKKNKEIDNDTTKIKNFWTKFTTNLEQFKKMLGNNINKFYELNANYKIFKGSMLKMYSEDSQDSLYNTIKNIIDKSKYGKMDLNDNELSQLNENQIELYNEWINSSTKLNELINARNLINDADIQISTSIQKLSLNNNANEFYLFNSYLNELGKNNFKDEQMQLNLNKVKDFFSNYIYNANKWESDLNTNSSNNKNNSNDIHEHTHSHSLINITMNAIVQNLGFIKQIKNLEDLQSGINKLKNQDKKDHFNVNLFTKLPTLNEFEKLIDSIIQAQDQINLLRNKAIEVYSSIKDIESILNQ